ncbi:uncharacterized protein LOC120456365 [Drosophila santomea]|uniref:uncharacterized protein LOC120456365 n=1 Tax=Drosophila santomea TaxID=129105 RepID=UPI00195445CA|nr:uncharacterized protein LOC120456365 [Drosophila santomea]
MWMQLGCRAFVKGAKKRTPRRKDGDADSEPALIMAMANADSHERGNSNTYLAHDNVQLPAGTDSVYLSNPSMNELMRTIHTASSMDSFKRVIVSGRSTAMSFPFPSTTTTHLLAPTSCRIGQSGLSCHQSARLAPNVMHRRRSFDHRLHQQRRVNTSAQRLWKVHSEGNFLGPRKPCSSGQYLNHECECTAGSGNCAVMISRDGLQVPVVVPLEIPTGGQKLSRNLCYWISLAHLLMVISCLRGLL